MNRNSRRQATLYLPGSNRDAVDLLRSRFNPLQAQLIRAHVTLCREDEVENWEHLASRLKVLGPIEVPLQFGTPLRSGDSVYLPASGSTESFDSLRAALLNKGDVQPRKLTPHITIIHPRNGECDDEKFREICRSIEPFSIVFREVTLIEQINGGAWCDLAFYRWHSTRSSFNLE
jgi:2'-5' RNA ligase